MCAKEMLERDARRKQRVCTGADACATRCNRFWRRRRGDGYQTFFSYLNEMIEGERKGEKETLLDKKVTVALSGIRRL